MDEINVQTQNFDADSIGSPNLPAGVPPTSKKGLIISIAAAVIAVVVIGGVAYYFLTATKSPAPAVTEQAPVTGPTVPPQVVGPQTPPPGPSDELGDISTDLSAIDLNALDSNTASDTASIGNAL